MKLSIKGLALTMGLLWAGTMLTVGAGYTLTGSYGRVFLDLCASLYPGYQVAQSWSSVIVGTLYGLCDGAIGGVVFAWLYNRCAEE